MPPLRAGFQCVLAGNGARPPELAWKGPYGWLRAEGCPAFMRPGPFSLQFSSKRNRVAFLQIHGYCYQDTNIQVLKSLI